MFILRRAGLGLVVLTAGLITGRPAAAQRLTTFTPVPVYSGTAFWVRPGAVTSYGFSSTTGNFPFFQNSFIGGAISTPWLGGGGFGAGPGFGGGMAGGPGTGSSTGGFGAGDQQGGGSQIGQGSGNSGSGQQTASRKKAPQPDSRADEGRLKNIIAGRLVSVEDDAAIIAVNASESLEGREAWVDLATEGPKLAASRPLYRLGTVAGKGADPGTLRIRIEHPAKDPGLSEAMPVWLLLPAPEAGPSATRPGDRHAAAHAGQ